MTESLNHWIAGEVRAEMARQRISHRQVAAWLGISQPQVTKRLRAEIAFRGAELELLAGQLDVPVTQFFPKRDETLAAPVEVKVDSHGPASAA